MKSVMRTMFAVSFLLIGVSVVDAQTSVSIGVHIGPPPPPRVVHVVQVPPPAPEYVWVDGYWYPVEHRYVWHDGYWTRPPYPGARWIAARYERDRFYVGYWDGPGGVIVHDHRWDGGRDRDYYYGKKGHGRGRGRGHK